MFRGDHKSATQTSVAQTCHSLADLISGPAYCNRFILLSKPGPITYSRNPVTERLDMVNAAEEVDATLRNTVAPGHKSLPAAAEDDDIAGGSYIEVDDLVRRLAAASKAASEDDGTGFDQTPSGDCVLLDVEVDDMRCLLLRRSIPSARELLSPREQEIARMVQLGYPNKAIAAILEISSWTESSHLRRIFTKLGVSSRAAMVARVGNNLLNGPSIPSAPYHS